MLVLEGKDTLAAVDLLAVVQMLAVVRILAALGMLTAVDMLGVVILSVVLVDSGRTTKADPDGSQARRVEPTDPEQARIRGLGPLRYYSKSRAAQAQSRGLEPRLCVDEERERVLAVVMVVAMPGADTLNNARHDCYSVAAAGVHNPVE